MHRPVRTKTSVLVWYATVVAAAVGMLLLGTAPAYAADLSASPSSVEPGRSLTLSGGGFTPNQTVTLSASGGVIGTTTADPNGAFSFGYVVPQDAAPNTYTVIAGDGFGQTATATFSVSAGPAPTMTVAPATVEAGGSVRFSGTGFTPNQTVTVSGSGGAIGNAVADDRGRFSLEFGVPDNAVADRYTVLAGDASGHNAIATFTVSAHASPALAAHPATVSRGASVTFDGTGFTPDQPVTVSGASGPLSSATADRRGAFSLSVAVPASAAANRYSVVAGDGSGRTAKATFTVAGATDGQGNASGGNASDGTGSGSSASPANADAAGAASAAWNAAFGAGSAGDAGAPAGTSSGPKGPDAGTAGGRSAAGGGASVAAGRTEPLGDVGDPVIVQLLELLAAVAFCGALVIIARSLRQRSLRGRDSNSQPTD